jgi:hypothetical protein
MRADFCGRDAMPKECVYKEMPGLVDCYRLSVGQLRFHYSADRTCSNTKTYFNAQSNTAPTPPRRLNSDSVKARRFP